MLSGIRDRISLLRLSHFPSVLSFIHSCLIFATHVFVCHACLAQRSCNMATTGHGQEGSMHHQQQAHEANCLSRFGYVVPFSWFKRVGDSGEWGLDRVQQKIGEDKGMVRMGIKRKTDI